MLFENLLLRLVKQLEAIGEENEEIYDSEVRERMGAAIMQGFVRQLSGYRIPDDLGMTSVQANQAVRSAIDEYISAANSVAESQGITKFHDRLAVFQNSEVRIDKTGSDYEEFFGHTPPEFYDENGVVVRTQ